MNYLKILILFSGFILFSHTTKAMGDTTKAKRDTINQRVHGKREGYWIKHRWNGKIKWAGYFVKGKKTGYWKLYSKNGIVREEGKMINGEKIGRWYTINNNTGTKLDLTIWDGQGHRIGGATLSW